MGSLVAILTGVRREMTVASAGFSTVGPAGPPKVGVVERVVETVRQRRVREKTTESLR